MLKPIKIKITDIDNIEREYTISRIPAIEAREIITQYPTSAAPKIGNYKLNEELMFKLLSYVEVELTPGVFQALNSRALIDNHVPDYETLMKLEKEMVVYNSRFLSQGGISNFLSVITQIMKVLTTKTSMDLSEQSSVKEKQPTTN